MPNYIIPLEDLFGTVWCYIKICALIDKGLSQGDTYILVCTPALVFVLVIYIFFSMKKCTAQSQITQPLDQYSVSVE